MDWKRGCGGATGRGVGGWPAGVASRKAERTTALVLSRAEPVAGEAWVGVGRYRTKRREVEGCGQAGSGFPVCPAPGISRADEEVGFFAFYLVVFLGKKGCRIRVLARWLGGGGGGGRAWRCWGGGRGCVGGEWVPSQCLRSSSLDLWLWNGSKFAGSGNGPVCFAVCLDPR